jgi:holin-like protein
MKNLRAIGARFMRGAAMSETTESKPLNIVGALAILLVCQLAGETVVVAARQLVPAFAFPGPVIGMAILFVWLAMRGGPDTSLDATAGGILRNLSLLFVPAAVGVVQYWPVLVDYGLALLVALVASTVLTLLVTVGVFVALAGRDAERTSDDA